MRTPLLVGLAAVCSISCTKTQVDAPAPSAAPVVTAAAPSAVASAAPAPSASAPAAAPDRATDILATPDCDLRITPLHHATMLLRCNALSIYVDPVHDTSYAGLPK